MILIKPFLFFNQKVKVHHSESLQFARASIKIGTEILSELYDVILHSFDRHNRGRDQIELRIT